MMTVLAVILGGAVGAPLRYVVDRLVTERTAGVSGMRALPWGLFSVNALGSAAAGVVYGATTGDLRVLLLVGFCGAFTTFSGFAWEADRMWPDNREGFWLSVVLIPIVCVVLFVFATAFTVLLVK